MCRYVICEQKISLCAWKWYRFHSFITSSHTGLSLSVCTGIGTTVWVYDSGYNLRWRRMKRSGRELRTKKQWRKKKIPKRMRCVDIIFFYSLLAFQHWLFHSRKNFALILAMVYLSISSNELNIQWKKKEKIIISCKWRNEWCSDGAKKWWNFYFPIYSLFVCTLSNDSVVWLIHSISRANLIISRVSCVLCTCTIHEYIVKTNWKNQELAENTRRIDCVRMFNCFVSGWCWLWLHVGALGVRFDAVSVRIWKWIYIQPYSHTYTLLFRFWQTTQTLSCIWIFYTNWVKNCTV